MNHIDVPIKQREPWNKAKLVGQKAPLKLKEIWAIRRGDGAEVGAMRARTVFHLPC
jgi:hypothetical protein